jgi:glycosyltransferase involved in cell wall biosynthesis
MNIVYHLANFPKLSESFILNEVITLVNRGHDVRVIARRNPDEAVEHAELAELDLDVHYLEPPSYSKLPQITASIVTSDLPLPYVTQFPPRTLARHLSYYREFHRWLSNASFTPDIIHGHFTTPEQISGWLTAHQHGIPFTITAHAYDIFTDAASVDETVPHAERLVTVTEYNRRYLNDHYNFSTPIDVVPACIRTEKFTPVANEFPGRILTIARFVQKKGIDTALRSVAKVIDEHPGVTYHIIGSGDLEPDLRELISLLGIEDSTTILGSVSDKRLIRELSEAQLFTLPCRIADNGDRDASPTVLKEAMAMETACISTTVSGVPEVIVSGESGVLVEPNDPDALADAIHDLLRDDGLRNSLAAAGKERAETLFSIDQRIDDLERTFEKAQSS